MCVFRSVVVVSLIHDRVCTRIVFALPYYIHNIVFCSQRPRKEESIFAKRYKSMYDVARMYGVAMTSSLGGISVFKLSVCACKCYVKSFFF